MMALSNLRRWTPSHVLIIKLFKILFIELFVPKALLVVE